MANREATAAGLFTCLQKLLVGGSSDAGVKLIARNRVTDVPDESQPSLILYDGDRGTDAEIIIRRGNRLGGDDAVDRVELTVLAQIVTTEDLIGTAMNVLEDKIIKLLANDVALATVLGPHGKIVCTGSFKPDHPFPHADGALGWFTMTLVVSYVLTPANP